MEINGVAHVILRVNRIAECIAFYDRLMPFLGLEAMRPRSDEFVYYVGGRTAVGIRRADPEHAGAAFAEAAPGHGPPLLSGSQRARTSTTSMRSSSEIGADVVRAPGGGPRAPGYYSTLLPRPRGHQARAQSRARAQACSSTAQTFDPAPDHPLTGRPRDDA